MGGGVGGEREREGGGGGAREVPSGQFLEQELLVCQFVMKNNQIQTEGTVGHFKPRPSPCLKRKSC